MKIAVISASFGCIDKKRDFAAQALPEGLAYDRFWFDEHNTPVPLPNLPPRLQAKYFKTQAHNLSVLSEYQVFVWVDANIEVTSTLFLEKLVAPLFDSYNVKVAIQAHHERSTIEEEIRFILGSDNPYLNVRYDNQPLMGEYTHYINSGMPPTAPLYSCNVFARRNTKGSNAVFDAWWRLCLEWSWFDQSAFSYLAWSMIEGGVYVVDMGGVVTSAYYTLQPHTQWNQ